MKNRRIVVVQIALAGLLLAEDARIDIACVARGRHGIRGCQEITCTKYGAGVLAVGEARTTRIPRQMGL